jgi:hypothetical protein
MKKSRVSAYVPTKTPSRVDLVFLENTSLDTEKALYAEHLKCGLTRRGIRRAIRKAIQAGNTALSKKYSV